MATVQKRLERRLRWGLFKAFWQGFFHPWHTEQQRRCYAEKSLRKIQEWELEEEAKTTDDKGR